ncbi:hypothetical protein NA56DRAFT_700731 [Hyaloscypha hepaticicola]|uniref:Uncharacterized protein n=1 Tax=Hyaloscypha hepaticicola TaxID=2082293 RepID=A0A2J6QDA8_9HELO|nr:hypothetical protein NA56DRAFT_700731 [Hyaloscypha hepaticicola]
MHSQLGNVFFRMEVLDDPIDIYTPTTTAKSSILSKRNQHKKVRWEESVVDNEYKYTIRKATYLTQLTHKLAKRLKGLWVEAQKGDIPEGFEDYATTFGTAKEASTAIQDQLWDDLLALGPKCCELDATLAAIKDKANNYENRIRIVTASMTPDSPSTTSGTESSYHRYHHARSGRGPT